jgi:hypothetical protein
MNYLILHQNAVRKAKAIIMQHCILMSDQIVQEIPDFHALEKGSEEIMKAVNFLRGAFNVVEKQVQI